jgi:3-oxoacyl-[acyl-carrier-protein] synthase II
MIIQQRRVVVTGVGLVSPVGIGTEPTWKALLQGESGIGAITLFDASGFSCRIAGEVKNFNPEDFVERKEIKKMGRFIQFALAASEFAVEQAGLDMAAESAPSK